MESFPQMLKRHRKVRGWSQQRLAEALCDVAGRSTVTRQEVYRWEAGRRVPRFWLGHIATVLGVDREELERTIAVGDTVAPALAELMPGEPPVAELVAAHGRTIGPGAAERLETRVHALRLADDVLAGQDLIGPAFRELDAAVLLLRESSHTDTVGTALLRGVAELAQIAGWIASDAGHHDKAEQTYRLGLAAARDAGDGVLAGQLAGSLAYQWSNIGRETEAVALAQAAVEEAGPHAPARARALFWDRLAWAHAKVGDAHAAMHALEEAAHALRQHDGEQEPAWLYWVDARELQIMEARAYTELHRPLRAVPLLNEVLAHYDVTHTRELALYLSWLAVAYVDANEPEQAAQVARRMLEISADLGSDRTAERAHLLRARLRPFRDLPEVANLLNPS